MNRKIRMAAVLLLVAGLESCNRSDNPAISETVLRRGLAGEPSTLDPTLAADNFSHEVLNDLYEGLTTETPNGNVIPGVASSWTVDASGTLYIFQLRPDARWSNGEPVRAQNFVAAWRRVVDPKTASPVADNLRLIAGAASIISGAASPSTLGAYAISDSVLVVKLEEPAPFLPQLLTDSAAYPLYSESSSSNRTAKTSISNGPYVLKTWSPGTAVELSKNPYYWDRTHVQIPQVEYQISDENSQFARYRAGQLDMTDLVPANAIPALKSQNSTELIVAPFLATAYYGLNLSTRPLAANLPLRQAMAMAIDRKRLVSALAFGQVGSYGFVPPGTWNYSPQAWTWKDLGDSERITEAKRLYAQAGYSVTAPLRLRLLFNSDPVIRNTAIIIAGMWKEALGIETAINEEEYRVFLQSRRDHSRWEVARLGWTADYNDASNFLDIFRKQSSNNDTGYSNPAFDVLLDRAVHTPDPESRRKILEASERMMLEDYPVIPLYFFVSKRLVKPYIKGVQSTPLNRLGSKELTWLPH
jgi:oligopeptide transport system substrate-binding protein